MTSINGATMTAGYYADGQRMWKLVGGVNPTYFLSDGGSLPLCEFDGNGNVTAFNTVGANGLLSRSVMSGSTATTTYYAFDFRGNTVHRLNSSGTVLSNATYKAYNGWNTDATDGSPYEGFGGQFGYSKDFSNVYLMGQRYYLPNQGRWLSRDQAAANSVSTRRTGV